MAIVKQRETADHLDFINKRQALISHVTKIKPLDPLSFFTAGLEAHAGERFYWSDPARKQFLVGLGHVYKIEARGNNRFNDVKREWQTLLNRCELEGDATALGTGPLLFGGFSFDPEAKKTALWRSFPDALFIVPTYLLSVMNGECWLTVNRLVEQKARSPHYNKEIEHIISRAQLIKREWQQQNRTTRTAYKLTDLDVDKWKCAVKVAAEQIRAGVMDKVALAREIRMELAENIDLSQVIQRLDDEQTESYVFAIEQGDDCFLGASPERLVKRVGDKLYSMCLASSIARGKTEEEDARLGQTLLESDRYRVEHEIVVQMIKEAMEQVCDHVDIAAEPTLFKARYIQHLYTPVTGQVRQGAGLLSTVEKLHPTPALGGYPQQKAVQKIREMEAVDRGWYAAPIGWMDRNGDGEFIGAIRCGLLRGQRASLFVGNGIVADSDAESEFAETRLKPRPMLSALGGENL